ncbi:hypothetical protein [Luteimonas saliphila]|nr:hypothetical protein [Luteimonas saliphila]
MLSPELESAQIEAMRAGIVEARCKAFMFVSIGALALVVGVFVVAL